MLKRGDEVWRSEKSRRFCSPRSILSCFTGCSGTAKKEETPTTITVWHVYGGQTDSPLNDLIDAVQPDGGKGAAGSTCRSPPCPTPTPSTSWCWPPPTESRALRSCPTSFVSYPKTVMALPDDSILVDYRDYFSEEELSAFLPAFVEEGIGQ